LNTANPVEKTALLERFGFKLTLGGAHAARTMMLAELELLLASDLGASPSKEDFLRAIKEDNCLGKRSGQTRSLTARHLVELYALDPNVPLFRALRFFWGRDPEGQPLLALLCAYTRDEILRLSAPFILSLEPGTTADKVQLEAFIEERDPGRFSQTTLQSVARNLNGTWTKSGHLQGHVNKVRTHPHVTPGATAYALWLGYLRGARGPALFETEYAKLLDCGPVRMMELAKAASQRGWLVYKQAGDVVEVLFPQLLTGEEAGWLREQA